MIKFIIFDFWKTLGFKKGSSISAIREILDEKVPRKELKKAFKQVVESRKWGSESEAYAELLKSVGVKPEEDLVEKSLKARRELIRSVKLFPHTKPMLKKLKKQGYALAILSNTEQSSEEAIRGTGVLDLVDHYLFSFEAATVKPDPHVFEQLLSKTGHGPEEAVMVGDELGDDVRPARKLGMKAILFKNYDQLKKSFEKLGISV